MLGLEGAAARGDGAEGPLRLVVLFQLQGLAEEPEDGVETHPGGQLVPLRAYIEKTEMQIRVHAI